MIPVSGTGIVWFRLIVAVEDRYKISLMWAGIGGIALSIFLVHIVFGSHRKNPYWFSLRSTHERESRKQSSGTVNFGHRPHSYYDGGGATPWLSARLRVGWIWSHDARWSCCWNQAVTDEIHSSRGSRVTDVQADYWCSERPESHGLRGHWSWKRRRVAVTWDRLCGSSGISRWEGLPVSGDRSNRVVHRLDRIRRIYDLPNNVRKREERKYLRPPGSPGTRDHGIASIPRFREGIKGGCSCFLGWR